MLYSIFLVCALGSKNCHKVYAEMPRPASIPVARVSDVMLQKMCTASAMGDQSFNKPMHDPRGVKVSVKPLTCVLSAKPPAGMTAANGFRGYSD